MLRRPGDRQSIAPTVVLVAAAVYFLVPVFWLVVSATKSEGDLFSSFGFWFAHFNLWANLRDTFSYESGIFARWLLNSMIYAGGAATIAMVTSGMAGFALAKYEFRGKRLFFGTVLAAILVPPAVLAVPIYLLLAKADLTNTYWSVILPLSVSPFGLYLCRIYADRAVPTELLEQARMDGASERRVFWSIAFRIMSPALATTFMVGFVSTWSNFLIPLLMLTSSSLYPVTLGLQNWQATGVGQGAPQFIWAITVTGALVTVVPLMAGFFILQKRLRGGLAIGALQ
jgi:multiple sugar transport system permease protein